MHLILPRLFINCERWKWNSDLRIYVSTHGHVKNQYKQNVPLKINNGGYFCVEINGNVYLAHRLVLLTWRPLPADGNPMTVDHLDSNKRNNRLDNLEWVSEEENHRRADEKLIKEPTPRVCEKINKPQTSIYGERVTWGSLAQHGINKKKFLGVGLYSDPGSIKQERESFRKLFLDDFIVAFCGDKQIVASDIINQPNIPSEMALETILDRFLLRSLEGHKYFGKKATLYWRKE